MANELKDLLERRVTLRDQQNNIEVEYHKINKRIAEIVEEGGLDPKPAPKKRTKSKDKEPDHDATAKRYADFEPDESGCLCGCGEYVPEGTNFVKGHHRRLQSIAGAVVAGKLSLDKMSDDGHSYAMNQGWTAVLD